MRTRQRGTAVLRLLIPLACGGATGAVRGLGPVGGRHDGFRGHPQAAPTPLSHFPDTDFSALYSFVQETPGQGSSSKQAMVFRRDKENTYLIVIVKPEEDKGKGYLKSGDNLWYYDPVSRRFTFTSAKDRFQNMNARNSDFTRSNLAGDYKVVGSARAEAGQV